MATENYASASFGPGELYLVDSAGLNPVKVSSNAGVELSFSIETVTDAKVNRMKFAEQAAVIGGEITGKISMIGTDVSALARYLGGSYDDDAQLKMVEGEEHAVPTTPYKQIVTHGAGFGMDLGVNIKSTGVFLVRIPSGTPTTGQYVCNDATGEYEFAAADVGVTMQFAYTWTDTADGGTASVSNEETALADTYGLILSNSNASGTSQVCLQMNKIFFTKLSIPVGKENEFVNNFEVEFTALADADGLVIAYSRS